MQSFHQKFIFFIIKSELTSFKENFFLNICNLKLIYSEKICKLNRRNRNKLHIENLISAHFKHVEISNIHMIIIKKVIIEMWTD